MTERSGETAPAGEPQQYRLNQITSGSCVTVCQVESEEIGMARLMAMGVCVGRRLEVIRHGNPLIVRLLGARIGISGRLARHIIVERSAR